MIRIIRRNKYTSPYRPARRVERKPLLVLLITALALLSSCSKEYTPKPEGQLRLEPENAGYYLEDKYPGFRFMAPAHTRIETVKDSADKLWFNIVYPELNACIYCTYLQAGPERIRQMIDDSNRLIGQNIGRIEAINEYPFEYMDENLYSVLHHLKGDIPSPIQFVLTDSVSTFFRGALYFDTKPNFDSIAPVLDFISQDIQTLIETFQWKK